MPAFAQARGLLPYVPIPNWWTLSKWVALIYLGATRDQLEANNLYDTYVDGEFPVGSCAGVNTAARTLDGSCNTPDTPLEGALGTRFIRFVPINQTWSEQANGTLYTPNPRNISLQILQRETFQPAPSINLLAAAWIQFQTHDWFSHGAVNDPNNVLEWPLPEGDPLAGNGQTTMKLRATIAQSHNGRPNTYNNTVTHWWDLSPVYGTDAATHAQLRSGTDGKLIVAADGLLPVGPNGLDITGFNDNWWAGLSLMHNIWTKEHNSVCDMLKSKNPTWDDQTIFDHARLITSALNAKVHTVEWTPALLQDDILQTAMDINWNGLAPSWLKQFPSLLTGELQEEWTGIIGNPPNFGPNNVRFGHSEEFVAIYRFHSLLRDEITIMNHTTGASTGKSYNITQYTFSNAQNVIRGGNSFDDVVYTFGAVNPGALVLNNFPQEMMSLNKPGQPYVLDMASVDIIRDRERGVPRYNEFKRLFSLIPATTMDDISDDPATVAKLRSVYGDDVESVDLLTGSLAESPRATGFAFSNTQFQLFIMAASRRLMTDRFFTTDYNADTYTQDGLDWIANSDFRAVIARNVPELASIVYTVDNAFKPWNLSNSTSS